MHRTSAYKKLGLGTLFLSFKACDLRAFILYSIISQISTLQLALGLLLVSLELSCVLVIAVPVARFSCR